MLGFSLPKLIVLALIIGAVWYGFKLMGRGASRRDGAPENRARGDECGDARDDTPSRGQDLEACAACGTYVARPVARCPEGRADCPMTRRG
jgi:uncharacterized protein